MPTANFPGIPSVNFGAGVRTPFGSLIPPSGRIAAYVHSGGLEHDVDDSIARRIRTTLNQGLAECRSGKGDTVLVLPGHTEDISSADQMSNLVAGTQIVGLGSGTNRPRFTWTTATSTFLFDVDDVSITNCTLKLACSSNGGVTVAAPITVSGNGCSIDGCDIRWGDDADDIVTVGITVTGDDFTLASSNCIAAAGAAAGTTFMTVNGTARLRVLRSHIEGETAATTTGVVQFVTAASTDMYFYDSSFINRVNLSVDAVEGIAANTGFVKDCFFGIDDNATLAGWTTPASVYFSGCKTANSVGENGADTTPVSA